jgi:hypothetical protein
MLVRLFCCCDKYLRETVEKEEGFVLANGFNPRSVGSMALDLR